MEKQIVRRLGLLVPAQNVAVEDDFFRWLPDSVHLHINRLYIPPGPRQPLAAVLEGMNAQVGEAARLLAKAPIGVIGFACTSGTFIEGAGYDREIQRRIEDAAGGVAALTAAAAVVAALTELGAPRISVVAPYPPEINERLVAYLQDAGFDVVSFQQCKPENEIIDRVSPSDVFTAASAANGLESDAIFVSCTALATNTIIDELEQHTGKPVVTSNQALFWRCMRALNVFGPVRRGGILLRERLREEEIVTEVAI
jgi:maleate isomerase